MYKKGNAFSLNTTVIFSIKRKLTDHMFHLCTVFVGKFIIKKEMFSKQVLFILPWYQ